MAASKCPKCETSLPYVNLEDVNVRAVGASWHGVSYFCPSCNHVLSVGIDPVALKSDLLEEIVKVLRTGST
jgi:hypothetical protein